MGGKAGLIIAAIAGMLAVMFNGLYLAKKEKELERGLIKSRVVVAVRDIPKRSVIKTNVLGFMEIPQKYIQPKAIRDPKAAEGLVNLVPISRGMQVLQSSLVPLSKGTGISVKVPAEMRGIVTKADTNLLSLINPGDHLDILLTLPDLNYPGDCVITRLQNVIVLSIGEDFGSGGEKGNFLTFALTPKQCQLFTLARGQGKITYIVRSYNDGKINNLTKTSQPALYERQKAPITPKVVSDEKHIGQEEKKEAVSAGKEGK
ncbi:Flp pilus assembly protein CpaB [bacterium]|nr:Flp pilus assembly protein CpaB [bacterium]